MVKRRFGFRSVVDWCAMPSFGFNPFAKRINVFTTGVEMGDAKRYFSRDVIRIGGERVTVNPILTPGEPGREQRTQFEEEVHEMVQRQNKCSFDDKKKLKFVEKKKVGKTTNDEWAGLRTSAEYAQLLEEKKRRHELGRYQLPSVGEEDCRQSRARSRRSSNLSGTSLRIEKMTSDPFQLVYVASMRRSRSFVATTRTQKDFRLWKSHRRRSRFR